MQGFLSFFPIPSYKCLMADYIFILHKAPKQVSMLLLFHGFPGLLSVL